VRVRFHAPAEAEHLDQVAYYEALQPGLGGRYLADFDDALARLTEAPERYRIERPPNLRIIELSQCPLSLIYRYVRGDIVILAVAHFRRRPRYWAGRND
jgi:toxin ParE1/3/4